MRGPLAGGERATQREPAGATLGVVAHEDAEHFGGGGVAAQPAADAPAHGFQIALRFAREAAVDLGEFPAQRVALPGEPFRQAQGPEPVEGHRRFLLPARAAAAEDELLIALAVGMSHQLGFQAALHFAPAFLFQKRGRELPELALGRADQITRAACAQKRDVFLAHHAAVHDPRALRLPVFFLHRAHALLDRRHVRGSPARRPPLFPSAASAVAGEDFAGKRQPLGRADQRGGGRE